MEQDYCIFCMNPSAEDICPHCGKKRSEYVPAPHHLIPGTLLSGKYSVGAVLGEGGFGITYIGRDINLDIKIAVKEYFPSGVVNRSNTASADITAHIGDAELSFEKGKKSFLEEARTLAKFSDNPNIVSVRDFFSENNTVYIVMEYLEGTDLKDYLAANGIMTFSEAYTLLKPVMTSLSKVHSQGLIHRDISPANIMVLKDGTVKLLDFGAARNVGGADEKSLSIMLKPGYAPEEQYRTKGSQGPWTDVYALTATMYKLITGVTPDDSMNRLFSDELVVPSKYNAKVTAAEDAVILKGLAVLKENRYNAVCELLDACEGALSAQPTANNFENTVTGEQYVAASTQGTKTAAPAIPALNTANAAQSFAGAQSANNAGLEVSKKSEGLAAKPKKEKKKHAKKQPDTAQEIDEKTGKVKKKPKVIALILSLIFTVLTAVSAILVYASFSDSDAEDGVRGLFIGFTVAAALLAALTGWLYYPRLSKKSKSKALKIHGGVIAATAILFVVSIIYMNLAYITIGDNLIKRNETEITLYTSDVITDKDLENLKKFKKLEMLSANACFFDDEDIKTLSELTSLKSLYIDLNTDVTDITPLTKLKNLTTLSFSSTKVSDISCLAELTGLTKLNISNTKVTDFSVIAKLENLETLKINSLPNADFSKLVLPKALATIECKNNLLDNIDFLSGIKTIQNVYAANNKINDLAPLKAAENLFILDFGFNEITDISPVIGPSVSDVDFSYNNISDISCLKGAGIHGLCLSNNEISDISALKDNDRLGLVDLSHNQITDISPLKDCFKICMLDLSFNQITDISAVKTIDALENLNLRSNKIKNISPLASAELLKKNEFAPDLTDNLITDISPLAGYTETTVFYLGKNKITSIEPLRSCKKITRLYLNRNNITDVSPLAEMTELNFIDIVGNPVKDVSSLVFNPETGVGKTILPGARIRLSYNENIDWEKLAADEELSVTVYDAPARQRSKLYDMGFSYFGTLDELLKEEESSLAAETETETEVIID